MDYHKRMGQMKRAQARYDAMEPPDDDEPEPEDVDEEFHQWECPECKVLWGIEDIESPSSDTAVDVEGKVYCMECLVDGKAPECELSVNMDKLEKHIAGGPEY